MTSTSGGVVRTSPLEVDVITLTDKGISGVEIIFVSRVGLDNVTTTTLDRNVVDALADEFTSTLTDGDAVRAVFEGTAELISVDGELETDTTLSVVGVRDIQETTKDIGLRVGAESVVAGHTEVVAIRVGGGEGTILLLTSHTILGPDGERGRDTGITSIDRHVGVDRAHLDGVAIPSLVFVGGDVVTDADSATFADSRGRDGPVEVVREASVGVTELVGTSREVGVALRRFNAPSRLF